MPRFIDSIQRGLGQGLGPADSPTFTGLTLDALVGLLKGTAGEVETAVAGTDYLGFNGLAWITVSNSEPASPIVGDLWIDTT